MLDLWLKIPHQKNTNTDYSEETHFFHKIIVPLPLFFFYPHSVLQVSVVPTTQLAKMSIDPKFVELTALTTLIYFYKISCRANSWQELLISY